MNDGASSALKAFRKIVGSSFSELKAVQIVARSSINSTELFNVRILRLETMDSLMVSNPEIALRALHEALVAARNIGLQTKGSSVVADIVDALEAIPLWIAEPHVDRTNDVLNVFEVLAAEYPECKIAAATAARLRRGSGA